jgi:predicted small metal-binding protein
VPTLVQRRRETLRRQIGLDHGGRRRGMRAVRCPACGHEVTAQDDAGLVDAAKAHAAEVHSDMPPMTDEQIDQVIAQGAYDA